MIRVRTIATLKAIAVLVWPPSVLAAQVTFGEAAEAVTLLEWVLVLVLSSLSGGTALLIKVSGQINDAPPDSLVPPIRNLPLLIGAHMAGSILAGFMAFFASTHLSMPGLLVGLIVPAISFGGAKACEVIYRKTINSTFGRMPGADGNERMDREPS